MNEQNADSKDHNMGPLQDSQGQQPPNASVQNNSAPRTIVINQKNLSEIKLAKHQNNQQQMPSYVNTKTTDVHPREYQQNSQKRVITQVNMPSMQDNSRLKSKDTKDQFQGKLQNWHQQRDTSQNAAVEISNIERSANAQLSRTPAVFSSSQKARNLESNQLQQVNSYQNQVGFVAQSNGYQMVSQSAKLSKDIYKSSQNQSNQQKQNYKFQVMSNNGGISINSYQPNQNMSKVNLHDITPLKQNQNTLETKQTNYQRSNKSTTSFYSVKKMGTSKWHGQRQVTANGNVSMVQGQRQQMHIQNQRTNMNLNKQPASATLATSQLQRFVPNDGNSVFDQSPQLRMVSAGLGGYQGNPEPAKMSQKLVTQGQGQAIIYTQDQASKQRVNSVAIKPENFQQRIQNDMNNESGVMYYKDELANARVVVPQKLQAPYYVTGNNQAGQQLHLPLIQSPKSQNKLLDQNIQALKQIQQIQGNNPQTGGRQVKNSGRTDNAASIILSGNNHQELSQQLQHMINGLGSGNHTNNSMIMNIGANNQVARNGSEKMNTSNGQQKFNHQNKQQVDTKSMRTGSHPTRTNMAEGVDQSFPKGAFPSTSQSSMLQNSKGQYIVSGNQYQSSAGKRKLKEQNYQDHLQMKQHYIQSVQQSQASTGSGFQKTFSNAPRQTTGGFSGQTVNEGEYTRVGMAAGQSSGSLEGVDYMHIEVDGNNGLIRTQELNNVAKSRDYQDNLLDAVEIGFNSSNNNKSYAQSVKKERDNQFKQMKVEILDEQQLVTPMTVQSALSFQQNQINENQSPGIQQNNDLSQFMVSNQPMLLGEFQYGGDEDDPEDDESNSEQQNFSNMDEGDEDGESDDPNEHIEIINEKSPELKKKQVQKIQVREEKHEKQEKHEKHSKVPASVKSTIEQKNITDPLDPITMQADKQKKVTNNDHIKFLNNLGGGPDGAKFRINYTRKNKRRAVIGKKAHENIKEEESEEEIDVNREKHQQQFELIKESKDEYLKLKARADAGEAISKKQLFLARPPNNTIILNYGPIPGRQPTVFFSYPPFLKMQRPYKPDQIQMITQEQLQPYSYLTFKVSSATHTYNCVVNALKSAGFHLVTSGSGPCSWNTLWTGLIRPSKLKSMSKYQKLNHFPGAWTLGSKANLWRNVQKQRRKHGKEFELCPLTYIFPEDYKRWQNDREMNNFRDLYILKPTGASCGRGIKVIGKKDQVNKRSGYLVSKYLSKPHLLRGYKYDLRIYIVVTCFEPLKAYIFQEGLVRLATQPFSLDKKTLKKRFMHLTNYSVNKKAMAYVKNTNGPAQGNVNKQNNDAGTQSAQTGSAVKKNEEEEDEKDADQNDNVDPAMEFKWSLQQLKTEYEKMGINYNEIFAKIKDLCLKTLMACEPAITTSMRNSKQQRDKCYEIYGFDVLIDTSFKPWLLEVNVLPSLSSSSPFDKLVKSMLLCDTYHLLGFNIFDRRKVDEDRKIDKNKRGIRQYINPQPGAKPESSAIRQQENDGGQIRQKNIEQASPAFAGKSKFSSPNKRKEGEISSPEKFKVKNQYVIPSFLDGFEYLTEEDLEVLATFEEEQHRRQQTKFEKIFPTKETIDTLGPAFDCQRHANSLIWQYIRQKQPIQHLKSYYKANPTL